MAGVVLTLIEGRVRTLRAIVDRYGALGERNAARESELDWYERMVLEVQDLRSEIEGLRGHPSLAWGLEEALDVAFDGIMDRVRRCFPGVGEPRLRLLAFLFAGLSCELASFAAGIHPVTARSWKFRWKAAFLGLEPGADRDLFLSRLNASGGRRSTGAGRVRRRL